MPYTLATLKQAYIDLGLDEVFPLRGDALGTLGLYANPTPVVGAAAAFTTAGPESARTGNAATFSGLANSYISLRTLAGVGSRVQAGGGLTLGFMFNLAPAVGNWRIGTLNTGTNNTLYFDHSANNQIVYKRNNVEAAYLDTDTDWATAIKDSAWHHMGITYDHRTAVWRKFIDGELWGDGFIASNRNTENDGLTVDFDNFIFGAYAFNGSPAAYFASAFCEVQVASRRFSDDYMRIMADLARSPNKPSSLLSYRVGPRASEISSAITSQVKTASPILVFLHDSRMDIDGMGYLCAPMTHRKINAVSGGRVANWDIRLSNTANADAPPGHYLSIAAAGTQKYCVASRAKDVSPMLNYFGSDKSARNTYNFDVTSGVAFDVIGRKESGGRGPVNYVLRGSDMVPQSGATIVGTENFQVVIASGELFSAAELTGSGKIMKRITPPAGSKYSTYQIELTNTGGSAVIIEAVDAVSLANDGDGPRILFFGAAGYQISSFYGSHAGWAETLRTYRAFHGNPPLYFIPTLGPNEGINTTSAAWTANFAAFCTALFADFPDAKLIASMGGPMEPIANNGALGNARMRVHAGIVNDYAEANRNRPVYAINITRIVEQTAGWTPWSQSASRFAAISEYNPATATYVANSRVWTRFNNNAGLKQYWVALATLAAGVPVVNADSWIPMIRYVADNVHFSEAGSQAYTNALITGLFTTGEASFTSSSGGVGISSGTTSNSHGVGLAV